MRLKFVLLLSTDVYLHVECLEFKAKAKFRVKSNGSIGEFYFTARRQTERGVV